jgi:hypothetical protein
MPDPETEHQVRPADGRSGAELSHIVDKGKRTRYSTEAQFRIDPDEPVQIAAPCLLEIRLMHDEQVATIVQRKALRTPPKR